jgi:hypothetical protein
MPLKNQVHVDALLSMAAVDYKNAAFIASLAAPVVPVAKQSGKYAVFNKKDRFSRPVTARGPKAKANEIDWGGDFETYSCSEYALREFLPDSISANADAPIRPRVRAVEILTDLILLDREIRVAALATTAANYDSAHKTTLTGNSQLDQYATSDPLGVIDTAKAACFTDPNTLIMGKAVYDRLKRHPQLLDHVKGGSTSASPAAVGLEQMAEIFEVERVLVGAAQYNSANRGQTASFSRVWGKFIVAAYIDPNPQMTGVSAYKTFQWTEMAQGAQGFKVRAWRDEERGGGGEVIEVETAYDEVMVCADVCYLVSGAVS